MEMFFCLIGMIMIFEGIPYFGFPDKLKKFMLMVVEQDDNTLRIMGGLLMFTGLLVVIIARRGFASL